MARRGKFWAGFLTHPARRDGVCRPFRTKTASARLICHTNGDSRTLCPRLNVASLVEVISSRHLTHPQHPHLSCLTTRKSASTSLVCVMPIVHLQKHANGSSTPERSSPKIVWHILWPRLDDCKKRLQFFFADTLTLRARWTTRLDIHNASLSKLRSARNHERR